MTSARFLEEDAYHARNFCVFSGVQKGLTHKGCILQCVSSGALSDVTVILGMIQSICDMIKGNGSDVADIVFEILAKKALKFLFFN